MAELEFPKVNGHMYSWASIVLTLDGQEFVGFTEINFKDSMDFGIVRGKGAHKLGTPLGEYNAEGSIKLIKESADKLLDKLGDGYLEKRFPILVAWDEAGKTSKAELVGCRLKEVDDSHSKGTDGSEVSFPIDIMYILRNGKKPYASMVTG